VDLSSSQVHYSHDLYENATTTTLSAAAPLQAVNVFAESGFVEAYGAKNVLRTEHAASHVGTSVISHHLEMRANGSGGNGPANADVGWHMSAIKKNFATGSAVAGEMDGISIALRQDGPDTGVASDSSTFLVNAFTATQNGFISGLEGNVGSMLRGPTYAIQKWAGFQIGTCDTSTGQANGCVISSWAGALDSGYHLQENGTSSFNTPWAYSINGQFKWRVGTDGTMGLYEYTNPLDSTRVDMRNEGGGVVWRRPDNTELFGFTSGGVGYLAGDYTIGGDANAAAFQFRARSAPAALLGNAYFDTTTHQLKICPDGAAYYPVGLSVGFRAFLSAAQAISASTSTKLHFDTEAFDVGSYYDSATNYRWTPPPGMVRLTVMVLATSFTSTDTDILAIYKNGSVVAQDIFSAKGPYFMAHIDFADNANGTDYYECWVTPGNAMTINNGSQNTFFTCTH
jgi:hypothetical protein